jgi:hypothetical protein
MLGSHAAVHTTSEPWVMLPSAYTLREDGTEAEYDANLARTAIRTFWEDLPDGRNDHVEALRRMHGFLYEKALSGTGAQIFVDKTPRYYFILPELQEIFPEARFILLVRNPLSVLSSILRTWVGDQWLKVSNFRADLFEAPRRILKASEEFGDNAAMVHYEALVKQPEVELSRLCDHIGIEFEPGIVEYGNGTSDSWEYGDPQTVYEHHKPQTSSLEKWANPENAQEWRLLYEYGNQLGEHVFQRFGADLPSCLEKLEASRPSDRKLRYTVSLNWLLHERRGAKSHWSTHHGVKLMHAMREGGMKRAIRYIAGRVKNRVL